MRGFMCVCVQDMYNMNGEKREWPKSLFASTVNCCVFISRRTVERFGTSSLPSSAGPLSSCGLSGEWSPARLQLQKQFKMPL